MNPRVLLVDDDEDVLVSYEDLLRKGGYTFGRATSREEALRLAEGEGPWDVALVDERLNGPAGPAGAASLVGALAARAPEVLALVVTGYAREELVRDALVAGAWDYLQKDQFLPLLLPQKVRQATEVAVARRLARTSPADLEKELRSSWQQARHETDRHRKGRLLETTLRLLFQTLPGLSNVRTNFRSEAEELDLVVRNESTDPLLVREGSLWLVECKNWSRAVDPKEVTAFRAKLRDRFTRTRLGLFVAIGGFTENVGKVLSRQSNEPELVLTVDGAELTAWIEATDRVEWLKSHLERALLRG
jgi:CheY-like chemotaxis protein